PPTNLFKLGGSLCSIKNGYLYLYGEGVFNYADFVDYDEAIIENLKDNTYTMVIKTPEYTLGYPTHNKKFKNVYIKTQTQKVTPASITVYVDGYEVVKPEEYMASLDEEGAIIYVPISDYNIITRH